MQKNDIYAIAHELSTSNFLLIGYAFFRHKLSHQKTIVAQEGHTTYFKAFSPGCKIALPFFIFQYIIPTFMIKIMKIIRNLAKVTTSILAYKFQRKENIKQHQ